MKLIRLGGQAVLLVLIIGLTLTVPSASGDRGSVFLDDGQTYSKNITMVQGHTMYVKYDSNNSLIFMVVDPNGNIVRYANSTYEGYFVDAQVGGNYSLVWQSSNSIQTTLSYDYNEDVIGLNSMVVQMAILVVIVVFGVALVIIFRRRRK